MTTNPSIILRVGIFFTLALVLAIGLSLQTVTNTFFSDSYDLVANFRQGTGVEPGTRVTLRGVPIGTVKSMDWDANRYRVRVILEIDERYQVPTNSVAKIQISSLLGGSIVNITMDEGPGDLRFLSMGDEIETAETPSIDEVLTTISDLSTETEDLITNLNANQQQTLARINEVIEENRQDLRETSRAFAQAGPKLDQLAERLNEVTASMASGEGTIGALYKDQTLYNDLREVADTAREITDQVRSGEGTLGALIYGDEVVNDIQTVFEDLRRAAQEVEAAIGENREGFRGLVASLSDAGPRIEEAINNFNEVSTKINAGDGTLGRLVNDPTLYEDAQRAVNQVGESFESAEEQGVFRSFLGLVFGALI